MSGEQYEWRPGPPPPPRVAPRQGLRTSPVLVMLLALVTLGGWLLVGYMLMRGYWPQGAPTVSRARSRRAAT